MSDHLAAAVERVWPGRGASFEVLGGGITNHNLKVVLDGEAYVLRITGRDTDLLGIDRRTEHEATRAAAVVGVGPEVVAFVEPEGWLVTRFIEGWIPAPEELRRPASLRRVGETLRLVHAGPSLPSRFDSFRVVEDYLATALQRGAAAPADWDWAAAIAARVEHARRGSVAAPCHNDLLNANFLVKDGQVLIVDYEYAGMGDLFFDLGNLSINNGISEDAQMLLLELYFDRVTPALVARLRLMRIMSDFREAMWGVVQQGLSTLDFDYVDYAGRHFARCLESAGDARFNGWLEDAATGM
jgi:thiamine kinase-like enzyme